MTKKNSLGQKDSITLKKTFNDLDSNLTRVFMPWVLRHPRHVRTFIRLSKALKECKSTRVNNFDTGLRVPPALILSITSFCNLNCKGCFAAAAGTTRNSDVDTRLKTKAHLTINQWHDIISEASELGVFCFVIAGGEPFLFSGLIELCQEFKDRFFLILTNGTILNKEHYNRLKHLSNTAIIVSIEGGKELTDARRGQGVYEKAMGTVKQLNKRGILTGVSVTITRLNFSYWMNPHNIDNLIKQGTRLGVFIEYIPLAYDPMAEPGNLNQPVAYCPGISEPDSNNNEWTEKNDMFLLLAREERARFRNQMLEYRDKKPIYIVHSPGDEEYFGGCVSAGKGFAHITPVGDLTPCPVSNIATHNLATSTLREALASPLFEEIRQNEHLLETEGLPCALFAHPKELEDLAKTVGAHRTDSGK
ncbi:MAG: radical SAM protein [Methanomassiliicoccales archaeon]|nr:MAG: radical SAM protein [Methanomassiliicoccales archaeon]